MSEADFSECRTCTCSALRRASRAVTQHYERAFRGQGLRATQFTVLVTLIEAGPVPLGRLADLLGMDRTTVTRNLRPLESRGLVRELAGPDKRTRPFAVTPAGRTAAAEGLEVWRRAQASVGDILTKLKLASG